MSTTFKRLTNNLYTSLAAGYTAGSGTMQVSAGTGALFGAVSTTSPVRFSAITAGTYGSVSETMAVFQATGISADVLSGVSAIEGTTDQNFSIGDKVEVRATAGAFGDIHAAINSLEAATSALYVQTAKVTGSTNGANLLCNSSGALGSRSMAAGFFYAGRGIRISGGGYWVVNDTSAFNGYPYLQVGSSGTVVVATGQSLALLTTAGTYGFKFTIELVCKTAGASGTCDVSGQFVTAAAGTFYVTNGTTAGTQAAATQSPIDTTAANVVNLYVNMGGTAKPITITNLIIEDLRI